MSHARRDAQLRRARVGLAAVIAVIAPVVGSTRSPAAAEPVVHVSVLRSQDVAPYRAVLRGFQERLEAHGVKARYDVHEAVRGRHLPESFPGFDPAAERRLILTLDPVASRLAVRHVRDVPVISALLVGRDEFDAAPNATGVLLDHPVEEQLRWLRRLLPDRHGVGVLFGPGAAERSIEGARAAAGDLSLELLPHRITRSNHLPSALRTIEERTDLVWGIADHSVFSPTIAKQLIVFAFQNRIPLSGLSSSWVKAGALYSLDRDYVDVGRQAAEIAAAVLGGASPGDIPVVTPRTVLFSVNLRTARRMRIEIPASILDEAAHVYE